MPGLGTGPAFRQRCTPCSGLFGVVRALRLTLGLIMSGVGERVRTRVLKAAVRRACEGRLLPHAPCRAHEVVMSYGNMQAWGPSQAEVTKKVAQDSQSYVRPLERLGAVGPCSAIVTKAITDDPRHVPRGLVPASAANVLHPG